MAARPWWPLPSGSKAEGPMGSCTKASSANRLSQPSRSPAVTAARDLRPSSRAFRGASVISLPLSADLGDDVVGEPLQVVDFRRQRLGVLLHAVGPAEAHDDVGDAELLELANSIRSVGIEGDHMALARV